MNKVLVVFISMLMYSFPAAAGYWGDVKITRLHVNMSSGIYVRIDKTMTDVESCGSNQWFHVQRNSPYERDAYSLLLAAKTTGTKVNINISGCDGGYPRITWVNTNE